MVQAPLTLYEAQLRAKMITGACTLRINATRRPSKRCERVGSGSADFSHREISLLANEYAVSDVWRPRKKIPHLTVMT